MAHDLSDYVEVDVRIRDFFAKYPDGSLQCRSLEYRDLPVAITDGEVITAPHVIYTAAAYRTPDDQRPGIGTASEPLPGRTPYTKGSEIMNAETSAWGRALAALGFVSKKIATKEDVEKRQAEQSDQPRDVGVGDPNAEPTEPQRKFLSQLLARHKPNDEERLILWHEVGAEPGDKLNKGQVSGLIERLKDGVVPTGKSDVSDDAPEHPEPGDESDLPFSPEAPH